MTRPKLLCVDDDPQILASVKRLLGGDFEVLTATTATEALSTVDRHPDVAIVLSDHRLDGKTGLELLSDIQTKAPDAVRAIFSGYIDIKEMVDAINSSLLHRFILKPWDNEYFRVQMLEALANHSTLLAKRELESLSITDSVTSLKNHRYFQDRLRIEVERSLRHGHPLSLAMIDLDHFKQINDLHGHPIGDRVLRTLALRLLDQVRSIDTVARYGGEEFAIIMPDTPLKSGTIVAERIRNAFERNDFQFPNLPPIKVTLSIGLASAPDEAKTASDLIKLADSRLYQAKRQGRNQTVGA